MIRRRIEKADCEPRYIVTLQVKEETGHCTVSVLDLKTDRYMSEKTMNKHGFMIRYARLRDAIMCIDLGLGEHCDFEDLGAIFGFHLYSMLYR